MIESMIDSMIDIHKNILFYFILTNKSYIPVSMSLCFLLEILSHLNKTQDLDHIEMPNIPFVIYIIFIYI